MPVKSREGKLMAVRVAVHRSWFVAFGVGVLFVALAFLHPLRAHAATITVTGNGDTIAIDGLATLREAITSINNQADVNGDVTLNQGLCVLEKNLIPASLHCDGEGCLARIAVAFPEHPALSEAAPPLHRNGEGAGG